MSKAPKVSIIILNWNGWKDTIECLESLYKIDYPHYEVIVVDNNSDDDSVERISEWAKGRIELVECFEDEMESKEFTNEKLLIIKNRKNYGFAEGNNVAIRYVLNKGESEFVLLLNNDTVVDKTFLTHMIKVAESDKTIGILGPRILNYNNNNIQTFGADINYWFGRHGYRHSKKYLDHPIRYVDFLSGACLLVRTDLFKKTGLLPTHYFLYFEDNYLCEKCKQADYKLAAVRDSVIRHKESVATNKLKGTRGYYMTRNYLWYMREFSPKPAFFVFLPYFLLIKLPYILVMDLGNSKHSLKGVMDGFFKPNLHE